MCTCGFLRRLLCVLGSDRVLLVSGLHHADRYVLVGSRHSSWYEGAAADWSGGAAVVTQIIASMTAQTRAGWQPDRTTVFCSWGEAALGNIGSYEWGEVMFDLVVGEYGTNVRL